MIGFQIHFEGRADKFADLLMDSLSGVKNEESDDFRSEQLLVTIYESLEACKRSLGREANQICFRYIEMRLRHSRENNRGGN